MTILNSLRKGFPGGNEGLDVGSTSQHESQLPIPGYDRLSDTDLIADLSEHSQTELAAIETYERSHKNRPAVFNKLGYLQGPEPFPDYDVGSTKEVVAGLQGADVETLHRARVYERKFQHRPEVLDEVAAALRGRHPASSTGRASQ